MKDLNRTTTSVAEQFFISDTQAHDIFTAYVDLPRLPLSEIIWINEANLDISHSEKYAFVIMNVITREIIDILHNHWKTTLTDFFFISLWKKDLVLNTLYPMPTVPIWNFLKNTYPTPFQSWIHFVPRNI